MKRTITISGLCGGLILAVAPQSHAQETEREAVRRVVEAVAEFEQAKNLDSLGTLFAPGRGVHIIEGAGVNHGWADYRDNHLGPELADFKNFKYSYYSVEPEVRGNVAWTSFRYDISMVTKRGPYDGEGRGTAVLEKRDGRWMIVHLHTSGRAKRKLAK